MRATRRSILAKSSIDMVAGVATGLAAAGAAVAGGGWRGAVVTVRSFLVGVEERFELFGFDAGHEVLVRRDRCRGGQVRGIGPLQWRPKPKEFLRHARVSCGQHGRKQHAQEL